MLALLPYWQTYPIRNGYLCGMFKLFVATARYHIPNPCRLKGDNASVPTGLSEELAVEIADAGGHVLVAELGGKTVLPPLP